MSEAATNPGADDASGVAPQGVADQGPAPSDDISTDAFDRMPAPDDGDPEPGHAPDGDADASDKPGDADDDTVEIEVEGQKVRIPKAAQPFLMMQADYTKKTQDVAEQRRQLAEAAQALESEKAQQAESFKALAADHAQIVAGEQAIAQLDAQLTEYRKLTPTDWAAIRAQDPAAYQQHADNYEFLRRSRAAAEDTLEAARKTLGAKEQQLTESQRKAAEAATAKAWDETHAALSREVKDWTPQRFRDVSEFAVKELGYSPEDLQASTDPRAWKMANELMQLRAENAKLKTSQRQAQTAQNHEKAQIAKPAERPRGNAQPTRLADDLSDATWLERRNAQLAARRAAR